MSTAARSARRLAAATSAVVVLAVATLLQLAVPAAAGPSEPDLVAMANASRAAAGAAPLAVSDDLTAIARGWSERMAREGRLYHNPAVGSQVCCWRGLSENVAYTYRGPADAHRLFMDSSGHRANLLNRAYTQVGIGTATDGGGRLWVTQVFRNPTAQAPAAAAAVGPIGSIRDRWLALAGDRGPLGAPVTGELVTPDRVGRYTHFRAGSVYWTPRTGAQEVYGSIRERWAHLRWEAGALGYPTTGERGAPDGVGRYNHFERGSVYWSPRTGAHEVYGSIRERWAAERWEAGRLGYPVTGEYDVPGGRATDFERGRIVWNRATGATSVQPR